MDSSDQQPDPCTNIAPEKQHQWLQQLVGDWTYESEAQMEPDKPVDKFTGTERVRPLGELWVICEGEGAMPGGTTARVVMTLGFDPLKGRFTGTFIGSMMTHLWIYDGELDAAERVLTLSAKGPDMSPGAEPGKMADYRDVIEIVEPGYRIMRSLGKGPNGEWNQFMEFHYRRRS